MAAPVATTLRGWLRAEPFTLAMSAGFFGFFAHAGVLVTLEDAGLLPARVSGASAGALVTGLWASGRSARSIADELLELRRADFWDPGLTLDRGDRRTIGPALGFLRGARFRALLAAGLPSATFAGARVPATLSAFDLWSRATRVLATGDLAAAIHASCAFPLLFQPVWVGGRPLSDGGIADRHGLAGVGDGERVLHHLLISRSPWRHASSRVFSPPRRPNLASLVLDGLPRVGPFQLEIGREAFAVAREASRVALDRKVSLGVG